jgi:hypothetical protein
MTSRGSDVDAVRLHGAAAGLASAGRDPGGSSGLRTGATPRIRGTLECRPHDVNRSGVEHARSCVGITLRNRARTERVMLRRSRARGHPVQSRS